MKCPPHFDHTKPINQSHPTGTKMSDLRKVMVYSEEYVRRRDQVELVESYPAFFHTWGYKCDNVLGGPFSVAIVERVDTGKVENVPPELIRFTHTPE